MIRNKAIKNISISIILKVIVIIISVITRKSIIFLLGNEAIGIYSLFLSVVGILSVVELGIGTAIMFNMYKPIVEGDQNQISALYYYFRKVYRVILIVSLVSGFLVTPFIHIFIKGDTGLYNIELNYIIMLVAMMFPYIYSHKTSFIDAHTDNYITVIILSLGKIIEGVLQIIVLKLYGSLELFMLSILISNILQFFAVNIIFYFRYNSKINGYKIVPIETKIDIKNKTIAMFMHKVGGLLVSTTDNILISAFIGIVVLGRYSNYILILSSLMGVLSLIFTSLSSILGHVYQKYSKQVFKNTFEKVYLINYFIAFIFFLGSYAVIDQTIVILFGTDELIDNTITFVIVTNYFIQFMRQTTSTFKDSSGLFYHDRYKPVFEGISNLVISLILLNVMGITGILIGTIITNIFITHIIEPFVLYKYAFNESPKKYYIWNYISILFFVTILFIFSRISFNDNSNIYLDFMLRGTTSVIISCICFLIINLAFKRVRTITGSLLKDVRNFYKKKKI